MHKLIFASSRYSVYAFWTMALTVAINVEFLLNIWLVDVPPYTAVFTVWILGDTTLANYDEAIFTKDTNDNPTCEIDISKGPDIAAKAGYKNGEFQSITVTKEGKVTAATAGGKFSGAEDYKTATTTTPQE